MVPGRWNEVPETSYFQLVEDIPSAAVPLSSLRINDILHVPERLVKHESGKQQNKGLP